MAGYYSAISQNSDDSEQEDYGPQSLNETTERLFNITETEVTLNRKSCIATTCTGLLGCLWLRKDYEVKNKKCDCLWLTILVVSSMFVCVALYYWLMAGNSSNEFSWYLFEHTGKWVPLQLIAVIVSAPICVYMVLLVLLSLCHLGCGYRVYLSVCHRVLLVLLLCICIVLLAYMTHMWTGGWKLVLLSLMIIWPYLRVAFLAIMTGYLWFAMDKGGGLACVTLLAKLLLLLLYIQPAFLPSSACVCDVKDLPPKPLMFAHRGAAAIAPENTVWSFKKAGLLQQTFGFESDVSVSYDGVPFLMHDATLRRTTDVADRFPGRESEPAANFNISELKSLNAGSWFLQLDPFGTVSSLSEKEKEVIQNDLKVPTLDEFLDLAVQYNKSIRFDLKPADDDGAMSPEHPYFNTYQDVVIKTILKQNISQSNVYWLYDSILNSTVENNFTCMYGKHQKFSDLKYLSGVSVSVSYELASLYEVMCYNEHNITLDVWVVDSEWLYSFYWCMGVHTVTTNNVHSFSEMKHPAWHLTYHQYLGFWIGTNACSFFWVILKCVILRRKNHKKLSDQELLPLDDRDIGNLEDNVEA